MVVSRHRTQSWPGIQIQRISSKYSYFEKILLFAEVDYDQIQELDALESGVPRGSHHVNSGEAEKPDHHDVG